MKRAWALVIGALLVSAPALAQRPPAPPDVSPPGSLTPGQPVTPPAATDREISPPGSLNPDSPAAAPRPDRELSPPGSLTPSAAPPATPSPTRPSSSPPEEATGTQIK